MNQNELINILQAKLQKKPDDPEIKAELANLLLDNGNYKKAEGLFREILDSEPSHRNAMWGLAKVAWKRKDYKSSHFYLNKLSSASNNKLNKEQSLLFAKVFTHLGQFKEASSWLDSAISQDSSLLKSENELLKLLRNRLYLSKFAGKIQNYMKIPRQYMILEVSQLVPFMNSPHGPILLPPWAGASGTGIGSSESFTLLSQSEELSSSNSSKSSGTVSEEDEEYDEDEDEDEDSTDDHDSGEVIVQRAEHEGMGSNDNDTEEERQDIFPFGSIQEFHEIENVPETTEKIVTFDQVGGLHSARSLVFKELVMPLTHSTLCQKYNRSTNPKVLLFGPPSCGKSYLSQAIATECEMSFLSVSPSDFADLSVEESESRIEQLFAQARTHKPSVIFIDELSWFAQKGNFSGENTDYEESDYFRTNILQQILKRLDPKLKQNAGIGLLAITNEPWLLDHSYLSAHKISKQIFVAPPSLKEKIEMFKIALENRKSDILDPAAIQVEKLMSIVGKKLATPAEMEELLDEAISERVLQNISNDVDEESKEAKISTEFLLGVAHRMKFLPVIEHWMEKAKESLKPSNSKLNLLWKRIEAARETSLD